MPSTTHQTDPHKQSAKALRSLIFALFAGAVFAAAIFPGSGASAQSSPAPSSSPGSTTGAAPTSSPRSAAEEAAEAARDSQYLTDLRAQIKGHEKDLAETVFKDIQILKGKPAAAILSIMNIGYNKSLGVHCAYCHDPKDWAADAKKEKAIARQMSAMMGDINEKYLKPIDGLKSEKPFVNCTTCHRGEEKPALDLKPAPAATH